MNYTNKDIMEFLLRARDGFFSDEVMLGALKMVLGLSTEKEIEAYLREVSEHDVSSLVNEIKRIIHRRSRQQLKDFNGANYRSRMKDFANYCKKNADELIILGALYKLQFDQESLTQLDHDIIDALRRSNATYANMDLEEIGEYLSGYTDEQITGIVNNVKGIVHEIKYVNAENMDGDTFIASMFEETNHPGMDITIEDVLSGQSEEVQLKATNSISYVNEWLAKHPDGRIVVTEELAEKMGLESSGISNHELTCETEEVIEKLIAANDNDDIWDLFPLLSVLSVSVVCFSLWKKYRNNEISSREFKLKCAKITGVKMTKFAALSALLSLPVVNVLIGTYLTFMFITKINKS